MDKIKIVFFDEAVAFGGSVVVLANLLEHIDRNRFVPFVVTSLDKKSIDQLFRREDVLVWFRPLLDYSDRIRWTTLHGNLPKFVRRLLAYGFSLAAFLANAPAHLALYYKVWKARPDLIHLNNGREAMVAARFFRLPLVVHLHGFAPETLRGSNGQASRASLFISISKYITQQVVQVGVATERVLDIPNPCPTFHGITVSRQDWLRQFNLPDNAVVFAHVGRLIRWKGQLEFLRAFAEISCRVPNLHVLIVGDDVERFSSEYPRMLREFAVSNGISERVLFAGHVSNILELMAFADVVVHSSIEPEPFGLVITEAMTAGAAVVAARLGAPTELIDHGRTGLLVDPTNVGEFAAALLQLAEDSDFRRGLALAGQAEAREKYSPERFARQMEAAYLRVLHGEKGEGFR